jgi:hypothetical protein
MDVELELGSLSAQLLALQVAVTALLRSHLEPTASLAEFPALEETARAMLLDTTFPDRVLASFERELDILRSALQR